jgi:hypothetical protein
MSGNHKRKARKMRREWKFRAARSFVILLGDLEVINSATEARFRAYLWSYLKRLEE